MPKTVTKTSPKDSKLAVLEAEIASTGSLIDTLQKQLSDLIAKPGVAGAEIKEISEHLQVTQERLPSLHRQVAQRFEELKTDSERRQEQEEVQKAEEARQQQARDLIAKLDGELETLGEEINQVSSDLGEKLKRFKVLALERSQLQEEFSGLDHQAYSLQQGLALRGIVNVVLPTVVEGNQGVVPLAVTNVTRPCYQPAK